MTSPDSTIFLGQTPRLPTSVEVSGEYVSLLGEKFYRIRNYDGMSPFFISVVSSSNHWLFISSTGGLSAGRVSAEQALFPYYTDDKLTENYENTGSKTIALVTRGGKTSLWEPFSERLRGVYRTERSLYKNVAGTALVFEEANLDLGVRFRYAWRAGDAFGFVRTSWLENTAADPCRLDLLDGLQNLLPANISSQTQNTFSQLLDAYKRSELVPPGSLAVYALNSTLTDLAEPSESLLATTVFQLGLEGADILLSTQQLDRFRAGQGVRPETHVRGQRCAYFVRAALELAGGETRSWHLAAEVSQDAAAIVRLAQRLEDPARLAADLEGDVAANSASLDAIVAAADGRQVSNHPLHCAHHYANVMFNAMRGGVFADQYLVEAHDFADFVAARNKPALGRHSEFFAALPERLDIADLQARAEASGSADLARLSRAYLPLSFSRRHGDPSRPWNRFAINLKKEDGSRQLDYEGNWRDIFQNWEALAYSYPEYIESMIGTFLNATTVDGYNPYRITRHGLDWEVPEPHNPWANIGYWSDHQIIYLQKLMEISASLHPGRLNELMTRPLFSYADVPYRIKPYADLLRDPYNSIEFDWEKQREIETRVGRDGTDAKLVRDQAGGVLRANLVEKLLTLLAAKLANFVPEGGIWMNTQRPEWNDANNALVGKGLSVVTLGYLRRMIVFFHDLLEHSGLNALEVRAEVAAVCARIAGVLARFQPALAAGFTPQSRRTVLDELGRAGSDFRWQYYTQGLSGDSARLPAAEVLAFLDLTRRFVEQSLRANRRADSLFHAYNILKPGEGTLVVGNLYEMLEGQVAILSSGLLSGAESLELLESMRKGPLYRADQKSYILYPDREVQPFLEKNYLTPAQVSGLALVAELEKAGDQSLIAADSAGNYHFNGQIRNLKDVNRRLEALGRQERFARLAAQEAEKVRALFESVFHHDEFTGRSGTFFAFEGLGSIYWHMVSKLLLAVQETILRTRGESSTARLVEIYAEIRQGQCFNKPPAVYGAFPTDPYSHTPKGQGAKQPGMTGMVKEEMLARQAELGVEITAGRLAFNFLLLDRAEFLAEGGEFPYLRVDGQVDCISLPARSLAYTLCQVPVVLKEGRAAGITVHRADGGVETIAGHALDSENTRRIFRRDGSIHHLVVEVPQT
jgi:hypothetical protein